MIDVGYLVAIDSEDKSYSIMAVSLDLKNIFHTEKKTSKFLYFEPGCWAGYDINNETDEKFSWGFKMNLLDYSF